MALPDVHSAFRNQFEKLHSIVKIFLCLIIAFGVYLIVPVKHLDELTHGLIAWDAFSLALIILNWVTFSITDSEQIRRQSKAQDSSRTIIFIMVIISNLAGFFGVMLLLVTKEKFKYTEALHLFTAIGGMVLSWFLIHTIFTLRYAHIYYGDDDENPGTAAGGLDFPGDEKPDYFDFAYFSFVLGMTFQVSDIQITSKRLRLLAMLHGLLSFGYNTVMIALTINLIAGYGN